MHKIYFKFGIILEDYSIDQIERHYGAVFTRWLPDGEKDSIVLKTSEPTIELSIWFSRMGFVDNGLIKFDYKRFEVDSEIISRQAALEAGPLMGQFELSNVNDDEIKALNTDAINDNMYINLGARIVSLLYSPINRFIDVLRIGFGQYWIRPLPRWNSENWSLGNYCQSILNLKWSIDNKVWKSFIPTKQEIHLTAMISKDETFQRYLTKEDWDKLPETLQNIISPLAAAMLISAHQHFDTGNLKHALIDGVTSLELIISELIRTESSEARRIARNTSGFRRIPLRDKISHLSSLLNDLDTEIISLAQEAISLRNKIIHDGYEPTGSDDNQKFKALLTVARTFLSGKIIKLPSSNVGNKLYLSK